MIGPRYLSASRPPLFERLMDLEPAEQPSRREQSIGVEQSSRREKPEQSRRLEQPDDADAILLRGADLRESVARGLSRLFDTRRHVPLTEAAQGGDLTVLDYGIPDFGNRSPMDSEARFLFGLAIKHAIKAFEPRLQNVDVEVLAPVSHGRKLEVIITGSISDGRIAEQVTFRSDKDGKVMKSEPDAVE
ncbi:MAG: type VI secretion system baseplate subunit TssE [Roseomonas sp.]|nr:type VI secretion system baseplate subunit TssE [Roseomonas sp.]